LANTQAGLHVAALLRDPRSYQGIDPSLVGREFNLVLGKHSGRQAVSGICARLGYILSETQTLLMLQEVKRFAEQSALMIVNNATEKLSLFELSEKGGEYRFEKEGEEVKQLAKN
jgi:isopropylmalate/homocitrate/citramalate synthase